jgi:hypothetical protein
MGTTSYRPADGHVTRASDPLPTADVLQRVKAEAWWRASIKAFAFSWPPGEAAIGVMRLAAVALMALTKLCPNVPQWRAARCLGLTDDEGRELWNRAVSAGPWAGEAAAEIQQLLQPDGEGEGA